MAKKKPDTPKPVPTRANRLSVVLIAKNEGELLGKCLASMEGLWDELVVVDTGSTDDTVDIAKNYGARIGHFEWCDNFAKARNYAESLCTGDYVYWQDADEILLEGKDYIRKVVSEGTLDGLKPKLIFSRENSGKIANAYFRQELLHKNTDEWTWIGAAHNYLKGPTQRNTEEILVEHLQRPSGDRPNLTDMFGSLRENLGKGFSERHLFYLMRQHFYAQHFQECIGMARLLLDKPQSWPLQRSDTALYAGKCYEALDDPKQARAAYLRALQECDTWADPYFHLGQLYYKKGKWAPAIAWLNASLVFEPPLEYFTDIGMYEWKRYDLLAVCLYKVGRFQDALALGQQALVARPDDERLKKNMGFYIDACNTANTEEKVGE